MGEERSGAWERHGFIFLNFAGLGVVVFVLRAVAGACVGGSFPYNVGMPHFVRLFLFQFSQARIRRRGATLVELAIVLVVGILMGGALIPNVRALNPGPRGAAPGFESGLCIVLLAILIDRLCRPLARRRG